MAFIFTKLFRYVIFAVVAFSVIQYSLKNINYTVSPKHFRTATEKVAGRPIQTAIKGLVTDLRGKYGSHILADTELSLFHLNVGGLNVRTMLLHASTTEYIAVFSTPFGGQGYIGNHWMNQTCTVLSGKVFKVSATVPVDAEQDESFDQGSNFRLSAFEPSFIKTDANTFVACYGRGFVPLSTIPVKATTLLVGGDVVSFSRFWFAYTQSSFKEFATFAFDLYNHLRRKYVG